MIQTYVCDYCGKNSKNQEEIELCETKHLGFKTIEDMHTYNALSNAVNYHQEYLKYNDNECSRDALINAKIKLDAFLKTHPRYIYINNDQMIQYFIIPRSNRKTLIMNSLKSQFQDVIPRSNDKENEIEIEFKDTLVYSAKTIKETYECLRLGYTHVIREYIPMLDGFKYRVFLSVFGIPESESEVYDTLFDDIRKKNEIKRMTFSEKTVNEAKAALELDFDVVERKTYPVMEGRHTIKKLFLKNTKFESEITNTLFDDIPDDKPLSISFIVHHEEINATYNRLGIKQYE